MKTTGSIKRMILNLEHPKMEIDIEYNQLAIFVGQNGVGKSLVMKLLWIITTHAATSMAMGLKEDKRIGQLQWVFDHSLDNFDFTGNITIIAEGGEFSTTVKEGEVLTSKIKLLKGVRHVTPSKYLSKDTRQFTVFAQYMKLREKMGQEELLEFYKLFDIAFMEEWLLKARMGKYETFPEYLQKSFDAMLNENRPDNRIVGLQLEGTDILYRTEKGEKNLVTTLGAGEQALLIMFTAQV